MVGIAGHKHQCPGDQSGPPIGEQLEVKILPNPWIQLDAHVEIIECRAYHGCDQ